MVNEDDAGVVGGVNASFPILMTMGAFLAISFYNVFELLVIIFATFKRRSGLYFWSFLAATVGLVPYGVGFTLKFFNLISISWIPVALVGVGLIGIVTGQSLVLYSRLHLIVRSARKIRWVLYMIIFDGIVFHIPTMVLAFGTDSSLGSKFLPVFLIYDKIQLAVFFLQECIISAIYIYETVRLLCPTGEPVNKPLRSLLTHLVLVNIFVLVLDIVVLGMGFSGHYQIQTTFKPAVYSIKLKVEFSVLNRLVCIVKNKDLTTGKISFGAFDSGNGQPMDTLAKSEGSRYFGSVGSGATVTDHSGFLRIDDTKDVMSKVVTRDVGLQEVRDRSSTFL